MDVEALFCLYSNSEYAGSFKLTKEEFYYLYSYNQQLTEYSCDASSSLDSKHVIDTRDKKLMAMLNAKNFSHLLTMFNRMLTIIQRTAKATAISNKE